MRDNFRNALMELLGGSFTNMTTILWIAYRDNLRDINPDDLPENVRYAFKQVKEKLEGKLDEKVKNRLERPRWFDDHKDVEDLAEREKKIRDDIANCRGYRDTPLNGMNTQDVKVALFEIYEKLPRRIRKPKVKLEAVENTGNE